MVSHAGTTGVPRAGASEPDAQEIFILGECVGPESPNAPGPIRTIPAA